MDLGREGLEAGSLRSPEQSPGRVIVQGDLEGQGSQAGQPWISRNGELGKGELSERGGLGKETSPRGGRNQGTGAASPETLGGLAMQVGAWPCTWVPAQRPQCPLSPTDLSGIYRQALNLF